MRSWFRWLVCFVLLIVGLSSCQRDKGDPVKISRDFIVSLWTGNVAHMQALTCKESRQTTTSWAEQGDPSSTVDVEHLRFTIIAETDEMIELEVAGVATIRSAAGELVIRDLDEMGTLRFILVDESGWKVCDIR